MNSRDITVYLDERWCDALEAHTGKSMETLLEEQLIPLIQQLPADQRSRINQEIQQEEEKSAQEAEANRRFSITRITENGEPRYLLVEHGDIMLQTALRLRSYLRGMEQDPSHFYADAIPISQEEMERYTAEMVRGSPRVVGIYDIDLDAREVYSLDPEKGWRGYRLKDISTAVYFATKRESDSWIAKRDRFNERMKSVEVPYPSRSIFIRGTELIPATGFTFSEEIAESHGVIVGYILADFDQKKVFGLPVADKPNSSYANLCFNYDLSEGCVVGALGISLCKGSGPMLQCEYRINPEEQEHIRTRLDAHFQETMDQSLDEYRAQYLTEKQSSAPKVPAPKQTGLTLLM